MQQFYLAHPSLIRQQMRVMELHLESTYGIDIINPFYDLSRDDIKKIDAGLIGKYDVDPSLILPRDLDAIYKAKNGIIAIIDGSTSYGTIMEIVYAYLYCKPVHTVCTNGEERHPWLIHHSTQILTSLEGLEDWVAREAY